MKCFFTVGRATRPLVAETHPWSSLGALSSAVAANGRMRTPHCRRTARSHPTGRKRARARRRGPASARTDAYLRVWPGVLIKIHLMLTSNELIP